MLMNMKVHLIMSLLVLSLVSFQAYPNSKLELFNELRELFSAREDAINRFDALTVLAGERQHTFKEELEFANSICDIANVNDQIKKIFNDNFEQSQEFLKEITTREQMNQEFDKENQSYLDVVKQVTGNRYTLRVR